MLCDRISEMHSDPRVTAIVRKLGGERGLQGLADAGAKIRAAQRFVLSPLTVETVNDLARPDEVERNRGHLFFPAEMTWIEWVGSVPWYGRETRLGMLFVKSAGDDGAPTLGTLALFTPPAVPGDRAITHIAVSGMVDLVGAGPIIRWTVRDAPSACAIDARLLGAWIGAALALINTPRLSTIVLHDDAGFNAARVKRGRPPVLSWSEVTLKIDTGDLVRSAQQPATGQQARHHVRAHMRLRRGRVEIVRPHWRGNPEAGIRHQRHVVVRAEDIDGAWKGGALPGPEIIRGRFGENQ